MWQRGGDGEEGSVDHLWHLQVAQKREAQKISVHLHIRKCNMQQNHADTKKTAKDAI
jgi:hypothetical protein